MASDETLARIHSLARRSRYRLSLHAERERDADRIRISELDEALSSDGLELLEDYPEDPRGHSHLVPGFTQAKRPIHAVCAVHEGVLVIVMAYRPDPKFWQNDRVRRERG